MRCWVVVGADRVMVMVVVGWDGGEREACVCRLFLRPSKTEPRVGASQSILSCEFVVAEGTFGGLYKKKLCFI